MSKIHLLEVPLPATTAVKAFEEEVATLLGKNASVLGVTGASKRHKALLRLGRTHGYTVVQPEDDEGAKADAALLIKQGEDVEVIKEFWVPALPSKEGVARKGGYSARGWTAVRAVIGGETVFLAQAASVSALSTPDEAERVKQNRTLLRKGIAALKRETRGGRVGFLLGDDQLPTSEPTEGIASLWDSRKRPAGPTTELVTADAAGLASVSRIRRWPLNTGEIAPFSVWVEVAPKNGAEPAKASAKKAAAKKAAPRAEETSNVTSLDSRRSSKKAPAKKTRAKKDAAPAPAPQTPPADEVEAPVETEVLHETETEAPASKAPAKKRAPRKSTAKKVADKVIDAITAV